MKKRKESFVGREAAVLRALTTLALAQGLADDSRSPAQPEYAVTGIVTIMGETPANLIDMSGWHYSSETFGLRESKGPTGKVMTRHLLSFDPKDVEKAREVAENRKRTLEEDARAKLAWNQYLSQPIPHLAEQIVNKIHVNDSVPVIKALATLDEETLNKVLAVLRKEEDDFVTKT